jgi:uncharacterized membrane protein
MVVKGFGVDKQAKNFYRWTKEYSPPPLRVQTSNFSLILGALCIVLGIYLGWTSAAVFVAASAPPPDLGGWATVFPQITGYFIRDAITLIVVGICAALTGRAIRWYLERDARLLRNAALIVSIAWSRQILEATANLLIRPESGYETIIFNVIIGILIGVASVLIIFVVHRSYKEFFQETEEQTEEFGEN